AFRQKHNQCKIDRAPFAFDHTLHGAPDLTHDLDNVAERVRRFGTPPDFGRLLIAQGHEQTLRGLNVSPPLCPLAGSPLTAGSACWWSAPSRAPTRRNATDKPI